MEFPGILSLPTIGDRIHGLRRRAARRHGDPILQVLLARHPTVRREYNATKRAWAAAEWRGSSGCP